ncbi:MAG: trypsin-like peptidase domain-containing protein [Planctomycetes bacterium]|jgi:serine protease Do|nr:trypsin-like peptidase domain-containing protein [Planctomycetota bacterium]MCL4730547.1 trypsin-like peptidase domain-containing protein [Planctomycetota bacterium]
MPSLSKRNLAALLLPALLLAGTVAVVSSQSVSTTPAGAQQAVPTLKALQAERVALAKALTPSVVAIAPKRPSFSPDGQSGMAAGSANACSGFVVDGQYVITDLEAGPLMQDGTGNDLYMKTGASVWMMAHDGTEFSGKVIGRDKRNLMMLIQMDPGHPPLPSLRFADSDKVAMGSTAMALGNTLDSMLVDRVTSFSYGTVSGFYRFEPVDVMTPGDENSAGDPYKGNVLEVDVAIHNGDHGGPIFNLDGEVIGMMCGHFMAGRHLGCAVPSNQLRAVLPQLKKGVPEGELSQAWIGFGVRKPENDKRIFINRVDAGSPAEKAGLKVGLELVRVDNYRIPNFDRLGEMLGTKPIVRKRRIGGGMFGREREVEMPVSHGLPVGTHIQLTVRDPDTGKERTINLIVGEKAEDF